MCGSNCKCQHGSNVAYSGPGQHPGAYVFPADVKTSNKTARELADAPDEDD